MKIVILDGYTLNPGDLSWDAMQAFGELAVYDRTPEDRIIERIGDAEIVYTNKTPLSRQTIEQAPNLRFIGVLATGYNVVDIVAARERGIPVTNIPTYGTSAVAQFTFALLLEVCHHIGHHSEAVKAGRWTSNPDFCFWDYPLMELAGKTLGIIGFGRIGQATAKIAQGFGLRVLAYDENVSEAGRQLAEYVSLDELLAQSDIISLHCPLFPSTTGIIRQENIARMKRGVIIINTSRGPLINEADTAAALKSGQIGYLAADVVSTEPIQADNVLLTAPNVLITPHIAWAPRESRQRLMAIAVDNLRAFLNGSIVNVVTP